VWIAGPLSGLIMQPLVGVVSDRSKSRWGRRRPFMMAGAVMVGACLLILGWASEVASIFVADEKAVCRQYITLQLGSVTNPS
jgi:solute carrier family 45, member 1/2/4